MGAVVTARRWSWCRICGHRIHYVSDRFAWVHENAGADHGPIPEKEARRAG